MAHLWTKCGNANDWGIVLLELGARYRLSGSLEQPVSRAAVAADPDGAVLMSLAGPRGASWILISPAGAQAARVNGALHGVKVLSDRDEVRIHRNRLFFSTESLPQIEPFAATGGRAGKCPRCQDGLEAGQPSVRCPKCGVWSHQFEDRNCWTYAPACASCGHPTALDAGFSWTPEALG